MPVNKESKRPLMPTPEEDAAINAGIAQDPDNPEWMEPDFKQARQAGKIIPGFVKTAQEGKAKIAASPNTVKVLSPMMFIFLGAFM